MRLIMQAGGRLESMENRTAAMVGRFSMGLMAFALCAMTASAQVLLNGGFESGSPGTTPTSWTTFNGAATLGTNCPGDANNTCANTVHSGDFSLKTYGPYGTNYDASGAYQDLTGASIGQTWKLSGYAFNWSGDPLVGSNGWGVAQIQFLDGSSVVITNFESAHFGTDAPLPVDQWTAFQAVGTVPAGTATMRIQVLHIGLAGAGGSVWFDDLTLTQRGTTTNPVAGVTSQSGVQVAWPTTLAHSYQVKTATNLTTLNLTNAAWANFGPVIVGSSKSNQVFDATGSTPQKFYNVKDNNQ
jgi:hypothetical protein